MKPNLEPNPDPNPLCSPSTRDYGRGSKNCVHQSMIPEWMDLVIWGHEHECIPDAEKSSVSGFYVLQPGSSVATSLVEGEAKQKAVSRG